jgi:methanethiol S-methyltransferase
MFFPLASFSYGVMAYAVDVGSLVYCVGFLANAVVPKGIDSGTVCPTDAAILVNTVLLLLLPVQHSIMARPAFKKWWTRFIPVAIERSTFVLVTGLLVWLLFWQWRPLPVLVWNVELPAIRWIVTAIYLSAWGVAFGSSFLIDHFDLFGLRQVYFSLIGHDHRRPVFVERLFYKWVRHPLMAGFLVAFWAAPTMSQGRLLFAVILTATSWYALRSKSETCWRITERITQPTCDGLPSCCR